MEGLSNDQQNGYNPSSKSLNCPHMLETNIPYKKRYHNNIKHLINKTP